MPSTAFYLTDNVGDRWRVHWVAFGPPLAAPHKKKGLPIGDARANYLWFVRADGHTRVRQFERNDPQLPSAAVLAAWVAVAGCPAIPRDGPLEPWTPPRGFGE